MACQTKSGSYDRCSIRLVRMKSIGFGDCWNIWATVVDLWAGVLGFLGDLITDYSIAELYSMLFSWWLGERTE
jgi:hypothetical protein